VGIGVSSRLVSMKICKRLVSLAKLVLSGGDWCLSRLVSQTKRLVSLAKLVLSGGDWCL
jgi:hypothetical protein